MRRSLEMPPGVLAILLAEYKPGESYPTVEFAILDASIPMVESDARRTGYEEVDCYTGKVRFENYFPSSGCGVWCSDTNPPIITATEKGLESLVGKPARVHGSGGLAFIFVGDDAEVLENLDSRCVSSVQAFLLSCQGQYHSG